MQDVNVVVTFYSYHGATEKLALAAAVGAVEGRANIRLRRLPDIEAETTAEGDRMNMDYVAPREADAAWADAIILAIPARNFSAECQGYIASLEALRSQGKLNGKVAGALTSGSDSALPSLCGALARLGCVIVPPGFAGPAADAVEGAKLQGRRVAEVARALRQAGIR
jgi:multimeric flavodoxin WrbA